MYRLQRQWRWSGGAMVLGKLPVPGRPTIRITVGLGPTALAVGAGGVVWTFLLSSLLSPSLWETARYRLKYCIKGPLNPKQPTNYRGNGERWVKLLSLKSEKEVLPPFGQLTSSLIPVPPPNPAPFLCL